MRKWTSTNVEIHMKLREFLLQWTIFLPGNMLGMVVNCIKWHAIVYWMEKLQRIQCAKCSSLSQNLFWILTWLVTSCPVRRMTEDSTLCYTMSHTWPKVMRMLKSIKVIKPDLLPNCTHILDGQIVVLNVN